MAKFDDVSKISELLRKSFPRPNPPIEFETMLTIIVSDDEFDEISDAVRAAAASHGDANPEVSVDPRYVLVGNVRWMPRSSARADYE